MNYKTKKMLKNELEVLVGDLGTEGITKEEYEWKVNRISEIEKVLSERKTLLLDPNVIFTGVVSIATALLVLHYEETNVIVSKAWNERPKLK